MARMDRRTQMLARPSRNRATDLSGLRILPGYLDRAGQERLLAAVREVIRDAPIYTPRMPKSGKPMSVRMTNCGPLGWVTDGQKFNARYGGHPPRAATDYFWTAAWMIPETYPTGTLGYKVTATDMQGNTQTWEPLREFRSWVVVLPGIAEYTPPPPAPAQ